MSKYSIDGKNQKKCSNKFHIIKALIVLLLTSEYRCSKGLRALNLSSYAKIVAGQDARIPWKPLLLLSFVTTRFHLFGGGGGGGGFECPGKLFVPGEGCVGLGVGGVGGGVGLGVGVSFLIIS